MMMPFFDLFLCQVEIQFVDIIEGHLVSVTPKYYQLIVQHHGAVAIPRTGFFTDYQIWVVL